MKISIPNGAAKLLVALLAPAGAAAPAYGSQSTSSPPDVGGADQTKQQNGEKDEQNVIIVTGARSRLPVTALPLTIDILKGEDFQRQLEVSGSMVDAVSARLPAFSPTREKLSGAGESLRGRSPLFAINGVPQSTPVRDGSRDGYTIDPFFIDRVEIIYGSNALQGIGATGGVVNQVTVSAPRSDGVAGRTLLQGVAHDGFGGPSLGGKFAGLMSWRSREWDAVGGLSFERRGVFLDGNGKRIGVDGTQGEIQDSDSWSLFGRVGFQLSRTARVEVIANRFELQGRSHYVAVPGFPTTSERGTIEGEGPSNRAQLATVSLIENDLEGGQLTAQAFFSRTRDIFGGSKAGTFQDSAIAPIGTLIDQSVNESRKLGIKLSYERAVPGFEPLSLIGGVDVLHDRTAQTLLQTNRIWVPETNFASVASFAQGNLKLFKGKLRLAGGFRYEKVTLKIPDFTTLAFYGMREVRGGKPKFGRLLLNGGLVFEPTKGLRAYGSYAEGYTIADVGRILRAINIDGVDVDDFIALEPVVSNNRELGIEWKGGRISVSAALWWSSSKLGSLLVRNPDGMFDVGRRPIELQGFDFSLDAKMPITGLSVGAAYARLRGKTDSDGDGRVNDDLDGANISPNRLNLHALYERGPLDARVMARFHFARAFNDASPATDFKGYALVDASFGYSFGLRRVALSIANLFDKNYLSYYSDTVAAGDPQRSFNGRGRVFTISLASAF